ncbi:PAS domain S-box protein [Polaromonas sp. CG_9.11]|uniref:PAS domain S-box protein n=1 Tax=Polaromonas sp. CG_9.11 TaxID=2787730 RepID=UPI0018CAE6E9|nr:PAS domain S-box protein [Polaromonas sp. CG_9.11]MBG6075736.1 PAS domain S-box-containing protein [Polaromonas sp. CG_9.11]
MKLDITLRTRLVMLVLAAIVPLFGLAIIGAVLTSGKAVSQARQNLEFSASLVAANQERVAASARQMLTAIATMPVVQEGRDADCQKYLQLLNLQALGYANLGIAGIDGHIRCLALGGRPDEFAGDRPYFQEAIARKGFVASGFLKGRVSEKPVVVFAQPVLNPQGNISAVAFATISLTELSTSLAEAPLPNGTHFVVTDRQGIVLAANLENPVAIGQTLPDPALQAAVKAGVAGGLEGGDANGAQQIYAFRPSGKSADSPFFVAVSADKNEVLAPARQRLALVYLALTLVAIFGSWIAWMLGGRAIVKPVAEILVATRQLQAGRLDVRIPLQSENDPSELTQISTSFNRMAESMQASQLALEAELARSKSTQEKLQYAQRLARIGYWQFDLATAQLRLSDEIFDFLGIDASLFECNLGSLLTWVHHSDRQAFRAACNTAIRTGTNPDIEFRVVLRGGHIRWIHQFGLVSPSSEAGQSMQRTGVIQDITARKNAELALLRSTQLLKRTGALAKVGSWELLVDTMTLCWSEETYRIHGVDPSQHVSFEDGVNFFETDAQRVIKAAVRSAIDDATPWDVELPLRTAAGQSIWVRIQGHALFENDKVVRLMAAIQDITAQHQAHAQARLLETCISHLNDTVMITEAESVEAPGPRIVFVNHAFERMTGYSRDEVVGKSPRMLQGSNTQRSELDRIRGSLEKWQPVRSELVNYTKNRSEFWVEMDIFPIANEKGGFTHWVAVMRDITERKRAEQALVNSEQRYAALFNTAPVSMWVYDVATNRYLAVNQAACRAYGYSETEFLTMSIFDIRPVAEHAELHQWLGDPLRKNALWHDVRKDGSLFAVETFSQPVQYAGRNARLVIALDKTGQEKTEKDAQEYVFTLQRAADAAQAITWHRTLEGTMQEIADQARGVIGAHQAAVCLGADSMHPQTMYALSLSEKYETYRRLMKPTDGNAICAVVCKNNRSVRMTQAQLEAHPGWPNFGSHDEAPPPMRGWLGVPLMGRDGKNIGMLQLSDKYEGEFTKEDEYVALELSHLASTGLENSILLEEIGQLNAGLEQKVAERTAALARQEALFRALAEQAPQMVWTASPDGRATYFNRVWFDLMGGALNDWTGYQWLTAVHPDDVAGIKDAWAVSRKNQSPYAGLRRLRASNGGFHTMAYRASPVLDEHGDVAFWVGIDADITEIKAIEAALRLSNQELEAFSYSVSHDLRSPLNTIDGFSRLLAKQLAPHIKGDAGVKAGHYLMRIQAGVAQMGQLIEDLLSLSQVLRAPLNTAPVDLSLMARKLVEEWRTREPERQVTVTVENGLQAHGDERLVQVVMENLLANAWKFTGQREQAEIGVGQQSDNAGLPVYFIKDNGAGFDMAYADKLFHPFQRLHSVSEFSGTGIGLATVSRVIKRHGGRIWAESAPALGTTFFFTLS